MGSSAVLWWAIEGIVGGITLLYHGPVVQRTPRPCSAPGLRRVAARLAGPMLLSLVVGVGLAGCEDAFEIQQGPHVEAVRPPSATAGAAVTVVGGNFGLRGDRDRVWLGEAELIVESWTDTALLVRLPDREPGLSTLVVRAGARVSAPYPFEVVADSTDDGAVQPDAGFDGGLDVR